MKNNINGIVIFGEIAAGKNYIGNLILKKVKNSKLYNIGDLCREIANTVISSNEIFDRDLRTVGQDIGEQLRKVDKNLLNKYVLGVINCESQDFTTSSVFPIITGGRTLDDLAYWSNKNYKTVGIKSSKALKFEEMRDGSNNLHAKEHNTEIEVKKIIDNNLCDYMILNEGNDDETHQQIQKILDEIYK